MKNNIFKETNYLQIFTVCLLYFFIFSTLLPAIIKIISAIINQNDLEYYWFFSFLFFPIFIRQFINLLLAPFWGLKNKTNSKDINSAKTKPLISVLIPAWNEEVGVANTIRSVMLNDYKNKEVIIINDGSTDNTEKEIKKTIKELSYPKNLKYITKENGGKASALNLGLKHARGNIIITIDADSYMHKKAIGEWVKSFENKNIMSVAGNVKIGNRNNFIGLAQTVEYFWGFHFRKADALMGALYIVGGAAAAYRREVFDKLGEFDESSITEDLEMSVRILDAGLKISYAPKACVLTEGPSDIQSLVKQRLRWKRGRFEVFYKYSHLFFNPKNNLFLSMFILPLAVLGEIILFFEWLILGLIAFYVISTGHIFSLFIGIFIISIISLLIINDEQSQDKPKLIFWSLFTWLMFYFIDFIEYLAQLKTLYSIIRKKEVSWQKWKRVGVFN